MYMYILHADHPVGCFVLGGGGGLVPSIGPSAAFVALVHTYIQETDKSPPAAVYASITNRSPRILFFQIPLAVACKRVGEGQRQIGQLNLNHKWFYR